MPQALRHSKVKLTWDQDDPERNKVTRRALTKKEIEEEDFRAYIASSSDRSDREDDAGRDASRDRLRALLNGAKDELPEGWGDFNGHAAGGTGDEDDIDMEITFAPGLTDKKGEEETTLERYQRKLKEKRKKRKEGVKEAVRESEVQKKKPKQPLDEFFDADSASDDEKKGKGAKAKDAGERRTTATTEELALLVASDDPNGARHFDMSAVLKAEKKAGKRGKKGKREKCGRNEQDIQEDFQIDVADERFKALHEDHAFALDPSNPQ